MNLPLRDKSFFRFTLVTLAVAAVLALSMAPAMLIADDAATATAEEQKDKKAADDAEKEKKADKSEEAKKSADESPAADKKEKNDSPKAKDEKKSSEKASADSAKAKENGESKSKSESAAKSAKPESAKHEKIRLAMLTLRSSLPETSGQSGIFAEAQLDLREFAKRVDKAAKDKTISGLVLDFQSPEIGRGKVEELRGAIARFRKSGKKVYATLESADADRLPGRLRVR